MASTRRFGLAQRLFAISGVLIGAMALLALAVWFLMSQVIAAADEVKDQRVPQLQRIAEVELGVTRASLQLRHAIPARTPQEMKASLDDAGEKKKLLEATLQEMGLAMRSPDAQKAYEPLPGLMAEFWRIGGQNIDLIKAGKKEEAFAFLVDKTVPARNQLLAPLAAEKKRQLGQVAGGLSDASGHARQTRTTALSVVLLVGVGLMGFAAYLVRTMRQLGAEPAELKQVADAVAAGDLGTAIQLRTGDTDSIMAALKAMSDKLSQTVRAVRENAESVATASAQIASGNADLSGRTEQQASALQETAASMEELGVRGSNSRPGT